MGDCPSMVEVVIVIGVALGALEEGCTGTAGEVARWRPDNDFVYR